MGQLLVVLTKALITKSEFTLPTPKDFHDQRCSPILPLLRKHSVNDHTSLKVVNSVIFWVKKAKVSTLPARSLDDHYQNSNGTDTAKKSLVDENTNSIVMVKFTQWYLLIWNQKMKVLIPLLLPTTVAHANTMLMSRSTALH